MKSFADFTEAFRFNSSTAPVYHKTVKGVVSGGNYRDKAAAHGKEIHNVIKDLTSERDSLMKQHGYKAGMLHDFALKGFRSAVKKVT